MDLKQKAIEMRKEGYLTKQIAKRLNVSIGRVSQLTGPMGNNGAYHKRRFIANHPQMGYKEVAKTLFIDPSWAYRLVKEVRNND